MRINQIIVKASRSKEIDGYTMVDLIVETSIGSKERHELVPFNDFKSFFDEMVERIREEFTELECELMEKL